MPIQVSPLNETDEAGNGIQVTTTYYFQIFNSSQEASMQRQWQLQSDAPLQYFFNFNYVLTKSEEDGPVEVNDRLVKRLMNDDELRDLGLPVTGKLNIFAQAQNQLLIRLTNYADKFDLGPNPPTPYVKVDQLALTLWQRANPTVTGTPSITISETSITGNQLYSQMTANKIQWIGVDDDVITPPNLPTDKSTYEIALEAQRIRVFKVLYVPPQSATFLDV